MDSPVIVDKASEFGESIDLDRPFPGFPFDDDNFGRRSDIRAHLDDLAARHPEFADHLLGPPWGDIPFHNSFRNRNRDIGNKERNNYQQGCSDEDAKSQASGSSVASGTSISSSHGESDVNQNQQNKSLNFEQTNKKNQIPQYGLRNTVDIGQHHHNMENTDKGNRGQRSMSAPPENRQSFNQKQFQQQEQQSPQQSQRYVSRIDITPQHNQPQHKSQPQQQQQQKPQQQSNVRHIPIFVEGRDEPVLPRSFDQGSQHRTFVNMDPHFQRPSPFGQHFAGRHQQWSPHFQEPFYQQPNAFEHPSARQQQTHNFKEPRQQLYSERQPQHQQYCERQSQQQHYEQPKEQKTQQPQQGQELPKSKPIVLKDPLERVALVQKEVDALAEQVKQYNGISRTDKEYIYLDEMLTRELIKLDDIETEGRDNVRQARKNAIKSIQETISLLESKAPLPLQQMSAEEQKKQKDQVSNITEEIEKMESTNMNQKPEDQSQNKEAIPLPPGPSSPMKKTGEIIESCVEKLESFDNNQTADPQRETNQISNKSINAISEKQEMIAMDTQQSPEETNITEQKKLKNVSEEKKQKYITEEKKADISIEKPIKNTPFENKSENFLDEKKIENISDHKVENTAKEIKETTEKNKIEKGIKEEKETEKAENAQFTQEKQQKTEEKMDLDSGEIKQSPKSQKKGKKTKKQVPISDKPIPLPAPESTEANAK